MNFEDEDYVRVYTKKTNTFRKLGWEGRCVLWHLFIEADKAGYIEFEEDDDIVESVATLIDMPEEIVRVGLERLASRGVTTRHGGSLVISRFVEAQNAKRSDRLRAQDYRDRKRFEALLALHENSVIPEPTVGASRAVTTRHVSSLPASPPLPLPCPASPPLAEERVAGSPDLAQRDIRALAARALKDRHGSELCAGDAVTWPEVRAIVGAFQRAYGRPDQPRNGGDPRVQLILKLLADGESVERLVLAVERSRWAEYMAKESNQSLKTILKDGASVDKYAAMTGPERQRGSPKNLPRQPDSGYRPQDHATEIT